MTHYIILFKVVSDWSLFSSYLVCIQRTKYVFVLPPFLPVINPLDVLQKLIIGSGNWPTKMKEQQRNKIALEVKFVNGVIEEIVKYGNVDTDTMGKTRYAATRI